MKDSPSYCDHNCINCIPQQSTIFSGLTEEELIAMNEHKSCTSYKKGQVIFSEHGIPFGLFCVSEGKIKISSTGYDGKEQILRFAKSGDIFGYRALISQDRYHCSAIAMEDSAICVIDKSFFLNLFYTNAALCRSVFKKISEDLKKAENIIVSLSQKNVRERLAESLLFFIATYGYEADGATLNVLFSREEIAGFVGTSTESVIRLLSEFNSDKIVELVGKKIKVVNLDKLTKTANLLY
ncbi:Crp/Fnr family transcriptional regulator [Haoranjiania flava]|uniref:Crp/Fnr family transcriptional regulator n=1 Tax=Haoranjiania flava TaxID=1856322 RepID=A0AAE3IMD5_9BACT|nr:Crp/Fnr family transcriptional regulator [Haoranjiania flava]MCU7693818.1 Crp/Fnr family transcriptional regulator [Haoranjiania flava]